MRKLLLLAFIAMFVGSSHAQVVFQPIGSPVYDFLDEMANMGLIELNTAVKPYSRRLIAEKLGEVDQSFLTQRMSQDLAFYLKDFGKETNVGKDWTRRRDLVYHDSENFKFTLNPIIGGKLMMNDSGSVFRRWNGAEAWAYAGEHIGFYTSLRDNGTSDIMAEHPFLVNETGGNYKLNQDGQINGRSDWSEMKGGITYSWKWGSVGIVKDDRVWGNNYNGANIFSNRNPSYAAIQFKVSPVEWFDFNYIHGWLVSEVLDSTRTYLLPNGQRRDVLHDKYMAANMFTFTPFKKVNISLGNSVVYGDVGINPAYLIPVMFYKSVDHTYNGTGSNRAGQNAQMFADFSFRRWKKVHIYSTLYLDELSISNMWDEANHTNLLSWKFGTRLSNLLPNTAFTFEYTRTNPWAYQHQIETTTFATNQYNMGHYLRDNSEELFVGLRFKPVRGLVFDVSYNRAVKGPDHEYEEISGVPNVKGLVWINSVAWSNTTIAFKANYELLNDVHIFAQALSANIEGDPQYSPGFMYGKQLTLVGGMNIGF
jgi:hypothetical protein